MRVHCTLAEREIRAVFYRAPEKRGRIMEGGLVGGSEKGNKKEKGEKMKEREG